MAPSMAWSLLAALLLSVHVTAAPRPQAAPVKTAPELLERPDPEGTPTRVSAGVFLLDLYKIDDVAQTFSADLILSLRWRDSRLARGMDPGADALRNYPLAQVWNPSPILLNARDASPLEPEMVRVRADGECRYSQRFEGAFSFKSDLADFPFDRQTLTVQVVIPPRAGDVELAPDEALSGLWGDVSIPNWRLLDSSDRIYEKRLPQVRDEARIYEHAQQVARHHVYYVWKLIVPLIIVVLMSWSVFWISPKAVVQLGLGATSVLTLIAYRFATATLLPPIGYLTRLDLFLTASSVLVLLALVEAILTVGLADKGRVEAALRIDRVCRVAAPVLFAGVVVWSFWL